MLVHNSHRHRQRSHTQASQGKPTEPSRAEPNTCETGCRGRRPSRGITPAPAGRRGRARSLGQCGCVQHRFEGMCDKRAQANRVRSHLVKHGLETMLFLVTCGEHSSMDWRPCRSLVTFGRHMSQMRWLQRCSPGGISQAVEQNSPFLDRCHSGSVRCAVSMSSHCLCTR